MPEDKDHEKASEEDAAKPTKLKASAPEWKPSGPALNAAAKSWKPNPVARDFVPGAVAAPASATNGADVEAEAEGAEEGEGKEISDSPAEGSVPALPTTPKGQDTAASPKRATSPLPPKGQDSAASPKRVGASKAVSVDKSKGGSSLEGSKGLESVTPPAAVQTNPQGSKSPAKQWQRNKELSPEPSPGSAAALSMTRGNGFNPPDTSFGPSGATPREATMRPEVEKLMGLEDGVKRYRFEELLALKDANKGRPADLPVQEISERRQRGGRTTPRGNEQWNNRDDQGQGSGRSGQNNRDRDRGNDRKGGDRGKWQNVDTAPPLEECEPISVNEETRWKAKHMYSKEDQAKQTKEPVEVVLRKALVILNKMTLEKFDRLSQQFMNVGLDNDEILREVVSILVSKGQVESHFAAMYSQLCKCLATAPQLGEAKAKKFRKMLLVKCQHEFEKDQVEVLREIQEREGLNDEERAEKILIQKKRYTGTMIFIGELFKVELLKENIIHESINDLFGSGMDDIDEEKLECMVKLMSTVGKKLDAGADPKVMKRYFKRMKKLSEMPELSARIRFALRDLIDLRSNKWAPRLKTDKAKTIAEIHQDIAKEEEAKERARGGSGQRRDQRRPTFGSSPGGNGGSQDVRGLSAKSRRTPSPVPKEPDDAGWEVVPTTGKKKRGGASGIPTPSRSSSNGSKSKGGGAGNDGITSGGGAFGALMSGSDRDRDKRDKKKKDKDKDKKERRSKDRDGSSSRHKPSKEKKEHVPKSKSRSKSPRSKARSRSPKAAPAVPKEVTEAQAKERGWNAVNEYIVSEELEETLLCVRELQAPQHHWAVIGKVFGEVLEGKDRSREMATKFFLAAGAEGLLTSEQYVKGFNDMLEFLPDLVVDVPKVYKHSAKMVGELVAAGVLPFGFLMDLPQPLLESGKVPQFVADVLVAAKDALGDSGKLKDLVAASHPALSLDKLEQAATAAGADEAANDVEGIRTQLQALDITL